jgi:hypothetical protein
VYFYHVNILAFASDRRKCAGGVSRQRDIGENISSVCGLSGACAIGNRSELLGI